MEASNEVQIGSEVAVENVKYVVKQALRAQSSRNLMAVQVE